MRRSKQECWSRLCEQVESDPWGLPYRLVTKKLLGRTPIPELERPGRIEAIVGTLFPTVEAFAWPCPVRGTVFPEITVSEIAKASRRIPHGKGPGPEGIPDFVVKHLATVKAQLLRAVFNTCFHEGSSPKNGR